MKRERPVTATEVARRAGVSQATVSLVLSENPRARVSGATRARVLRIPRELGYRPNVVARSLVSRRSYTLGLLLPDFSNPFYTMVASGAERVAAEEGYALLLAETVATPAVRHLEAWMGRQVDGVILDPLNASAQDAAALLEQFNVVLVDEPGQRWPGVASDAVAAGRLMAEHLLELGHRRVAVLGPATDAHWARGRERGITSVLRDHGVEIESPLLRRVAPTAAGGEAGMRALLSLPTPPTAVACLNDLVAVGAMKAAMRRGVRVPDDVSIVGCDDLELARLVTPELTTVTIPARELGARAARLLIRRLAGRAPQSPSRALPVKLAIRGTTAPPNQSR